MPKTRSTRSRTRPLRRNAAQTAIGASPNSVNTAAPHQSCSIRNLAAAYATHTVPWELGRHSAGWSTEMLGTFVHEFFMRAGHWINFIQLLKVLADLPTALVRGLTLRDLGMSDDNARFAVDMSSNVFWLFVRMHELRARPEFLNSLVPQWIQLYESEEAILDGALPASTRRTILLRTLRNSPDFMTEWLLGLRDADCNPITEGEPLRDVLELLEPADLALLLRTADCKSRSCAREILHHIEHGSLVVGRGAHRS